jgi:tetratricopeptide (TPR) repeat protein
MRKIRSGELSMGLAITDERPLDDDPDRDMVIDSIRCSLSDGPVIMNAIRDSQTGEMVATDVIRASKVTARFRNVAERGGVVSLAFDVSVPSGMADSRWQLKILPSMSIMGDTVALDPVYITGADYRAAQLRGYERYRTFVSGIITDTTDLVRMRQLEIFLQRHYPEAYAMKTDSSLVSEPLMENLFGVTQEQVAEHYKRHLRMWMNKRKSDRAEMMYHKFVKDPILNTGIRLDTVLLGNEGDFIYRYVHTFRSRPRLKRVDISLKGSLYEKGERVLELPFSQVLTFYISSLSALADERPRYKMVVLDRMVYDNTKALIDFGLGKAEIDTSLADNAAELRRIRKCIDDVVARRDLVLDSLIVVASCSPEGSFDLNSRLSKARSRSVLEYISEYVPDQWCGHLKTSQLPENWAQLERLISSDTVIAAGVKDEMMRVIQGQDSPDVRELKLSRMKGYRYLREKLYPQLRSVAFDFHLHRAGMVKDTVHTTQLDSVYMAGVKALKDLDYKTAVELLRPYDDFNSALAFMSADYNHSALDVLERLGNTDPKVCYLKALVLSRLELIDEAMKYYRLAIMYDPYLEHRANLDPEMHALTNIYKQL